MFAIFVFYAPSMPGYKFSILPSGIVEFVMQRILLNSTLTLKMQIWSIYYRNDDGSQTKSKTKILVVLKITWCSIAFCTAVSGKSFHWNGNLVLWKSDCTIYYVDGMGCAFHRGPFDVNDELKEIVRLSDDRYYSFQVYFSSQLFVPYIY